MLPRYIEKFGSTYDLSLQAKYPVNIPPKNTENTIVNIRNVTKSIAEFARNDDQTIDPINRNAPNTTNENMIIGRLAFSVKFSKNPFLLLFMTGFNRLQPHSVQNSEEPYP